MKRNTHIVNVFVMHNKLHKTNYTFFQTVLRKASSGLNERLAGSAYFQTFTLVVPQSWSALACGFTETRLTPDTPYMDADIVIGADHPIHGSAPFVQHSGGCGAQGDMIYLPRTFLTKMVNVSRSSDDIVQSWLEYRYGVFPDETYPGDPLYPNVFVNNHNDSHHVMPSKQLVLCKGRSVDQVVQAHPDFIDIKTDNEPLRAILPELRVVKEPRVQYVLAIETTASMEDNEDWKWVNKAAQKLIRYDLPVNSEISVLTFSNITRVEHPLVKLVDEDTRAKVADTIPGKYRLASHNMRCVACVLETMVQNVLEKGSMGTHLILITRAGSDSLSLTDERIITEYVKNYGIKISTIMIPTVNHLPFYDDISLISGGSSFLVHESAFSMDKYVSILDSVQSIMARETITVNPAMITIHRNQHYTEGDGNETSGSFVVDSSLGETTIGIYVEDTEDHLIKSVSLQDEEGTVYGPYSKMSTTFDLINFKTVNVVGDSPLSNHKVREWRYTIQWFEHRGHTRKSVVRVTSRNKPEREDNLALNSWTRRSKTIHGYRPVEIFAELSKGSSPVLGAEVYATVEMENDNGTIVTLSRVELDDSGLGDVDMQQGDGVYSGVLINHQGTGRYTFTIHASDNKRRAHIIRPGQPELPIVCCGSFLDIPQSRGVIMESFKRTIPGPVVHLSTLPREDITPPSKIGDLIIELSSDNKTLSAKWSSPGGDYRSGSVVSYQFIYSANISQLLEDRDGSTLLELEKHTSFGSSVTQLLEFPLYNQDYFIGLYAYDLAGNRGRMSNIQHIYVSAPPPTSTPLPIPRLGLPPSTSTDWMMIIAISSGLGALLVVCLLSIAYYLFTARKGRPDSPSPSSLSTKEDMPHSEHTDSSSCHSDRQGSSQLDVKELESQVTDLHQILNEQTRITPVYWSASQLLSKLDSPEKHAKESYHNQSFGYYGTVIPVPDDVSSRNGAVNRTFDHEPPVFRSSSPLGAVDVDQQYLQTESPLAQEHLARTPRHQHEHRPPRFERNNFYRSSRRQRSYEEDSYQGFGTPLPPARRDPGPPADIPDEFCVTVSSISNSDSESLSDKLRPPHILPKPRNITEV